MRRKEDEQCIERDGLGRDARAGIGDTVVYVRGERREAPCR